MTSLSLRNASPAKSKADAVVVGVTTSPAPKRRRTNASGPDVVLAPGADDVAAAYGRKLSPLLASLGVNGKAGEVHSVPTSGAINAPLLVLVGLGPEVTPDAVRRAAGVAARSVPNAASAALALPADSPELVRAAAEGWLLGGYTFTAFKGSDVTPRPTGPSEVVVLTSAARRKETQQALTEAEVLAEAVAGARSWVNTPPGDFTPPRFADAVLEATADLTSGRGAPLEITVLDEKRLAELGCGGILGVGQGSDAPPRLVEISYAPKGAQAHLALVGKGITFDSGGLSIKPAASMKEMKSDMAGAAAVVQATIAIARLGLPIRVSCFAPMAENMVSGRSMRPGDVLTMYGGKTVEVQNTDAEGRLVLADALVRATEMSPDVILDVATLTGAMVMALGDRVSGVMGGDDVVPGVLAASEVAGEAMWHMPLPEEMKQRVLSSKIADVMQHDWVRWGGGLFAGAFLREFTAGKPWAHLDIAGPSFNSGSPWGHVTNGGTGVAVTTLVEYARSLSATAG
ncbi:leucyl aminopeptidase [Nocardioides acrostichi]|uniref:Probable cytosol aminopeptidase n=1 Tax=Nocardioides acrostichi TaxID=2784339 RepID=A0A930V226_9ACTN|nr:leucyl aminopeptidase [Nocardioides acrostichi]MBF4162300.1 leucyl aminopeptidase [Nocardioides acrostichi]